MRLANSMTAERREKLDIVFELNTTSDIHALQVVIETSKFFAFFVAGQLIGVDQLRRKVEAASKWNQVLEADGLTFRFGVVQAYGQCFLQIQESRPDAAKSWGKWAHAFLGRAGFVQAWVSDCDYDYWQNAQDPLLYETAGLDYSNLPLKTNGLPPPLTRQIIDISKNPGRWSLRQGYVEAIGTPMWLGPAFFRYVGEEVRQSLLSISWPEVELGPNGVLKLTAAQSCFTDESSAALQTQLRQLIYRQG